MRKYTYDFEISVMITSLASALDDIVVKRYNRYREPQDSIRCRFVYAPKQRVLADLLDKAQNLQLPVVALTNGGIARDPNRVFNKIQGSYMTSSDPTKTNKLLQPVPIDLTINMTILTRFQEDFDQIVTNFIPYFDPYIIISWRTPSMPDYEIRSQVVWSGNVAANYPYDINATQVARVEGTTSFTFKGWLFKAKPSGPEGTIFNVNSNFSTESGLKSMLSLDALNELTTERHYLSGHPQPQIIN
jgi:hypothetical protein